MISNSVTNNFVNNDGIRSYSWVNLNYLLHLGSSSIGCEHYPVNLKADHPTQTVRNQILFSFLLVNMQSVEEKVKSIKLRCICHCIISGNSSSLGGCTWAIILEVSTILISRISCLQSKYSHI